MSTILTRGAATDSDLPYDGPMKTHLAALPSTRAWYQMDAEHATIDVNNAISSLRPVGTGVQLAPAGAATGPTLADRSAYGGFSVALYDSAATSRSLLGTASYFAGQFSILAYCRRGTISAVAAPIVQPAGTGGAMTALQCGADGAWQAWHKNSGLTLTGPSPPDSTPQLIIASFDGTTFRAQVDGYAQRTAVPTGAVPANHELSIGGNSNNRFIGDISDIVILSVPVLEASQAGLLAQWRDYFNETYG